MTPHIFSNNKLSFSPVAGSVFGPKDPPPNAIGGLSNSNHHDPWNRLHGGPSGFPAAHSWAKAAEKRDERDRVKDGERREILHIKDEKDRYYFEI